MQTTTDKATSTIEQVNTQPAKVGNFGNGRYSALMEECFYDAQRLFKLDERQADKLAHAIGRDFGAAMKDAKVDAKVGKSTSKDGKVTLAEAAKAKGLTITNPLRALQIMQYMNDAGKYSISSGDTQWKVVGEFGEWLSNL